MKTIIKSDHRKIGLSQISQAYATVFFAVALAICLSSTSKAAEFASANQLGGRIGAWLNAGDAPVEVGGIDGQRFSNANMYAEVFYGWRLNNFFVGEASAGVSNRSDISFSESGSELIGSVNVYPIQLSMKMYPTGSRSLFGLHLYFQGGGGLYVASQTSQSIYTISGVSRRSATDFNFLLGTGIDIPVGGSAALNMAVKYHKIFYGGEGFAGLNDYSGVQATIGAAYLMLK